MAVRSWPSSWVGANYFNAMSTFAETQQTELILVLRHKHGTKNPILFSVIWTTNVLHLYGSFFCLINTRS